MALTIICLKCIKAVEIVDTAPSPSASDRRVALLRCHGESFLKTIYRWQLTAEGDHRETLTALVSFGHGPTESAASAFNTLAHSGEQFDFFMRVLEQCGDSEDNAPRHATDLAATITANYQLLERLSARLLALVQRVEQTKK